MGKKISNVVKKVTKPVTSVIKDPLKNPLQTVGAIAGGATTAGGLGSILGATVGKEAGKLLGMGGGSSPGPQLDRSKFDLNPQAQRYEQMLLEARERNLKNNQAFTEQLQKQARGEGPSLATAQLKAAQNRNLAQTLAAAQAQNASPLSTRQLLQQRGQSSRDIAELGGMQRMQEQQAAQQMLGSQLGQEANIARGDISQGFDIARAPVDMMANYETNRFAADVARRNAVKQQQSQILGGLLGAGGQVGAALLSDEQQKTSPKKKTNFQEALSRYQPKDAGDAIAGAGDIIAGAIKDRKEEAAARRNPSTKPMMKASADIMSDEQQKQAPSKLPSAKKEVNDFLDKLSARQFEYKDASLPGTAEGTRYGITAQDLERSSLGKTLVKNTAQGKMVDTVQGFGAVLAAQAELNRRLKKIEGKKKA
jgi:hypothetical protein